MSIYKDHSNGLGYPIYAFDSVALETGCEYHGLQIEHYLQK